MTRVTHQFSLFTQKEMRPKLKLKQLVSAADIRKAKELYAKGDAKASAEMLRTVREGLENFERRINTKQSEK